jgi:hypothetical protein
MMTEEKNPRVKEVLRQLSDKELLALDGKVVPTTMIPAIWEEKTGQAFSRTAPLQAKKAGRIKPMGQNRSVLYWWRDEVEKAAIPQSKKRGRPKKEE